jgi:hypothetical protein
MQTPKKRCRIGARACQDHLTIFLTVGRIVAMAQSTERPLLSRLSRKVSIVVDSRCCICPGGHVEPFSRIHCDNQTIRGTIGMVEHLISGFLPLMQRNNVMAIVEGSVVGYLVGALPGLSATTLNIPGIRKWHVLIIVAAGYSVATYYPFGQVLMVQLR